ncbi:hypothetical protein ACFV4N_13430 [Actinosynnema sp. NPDC059797]
MSEAELREGLRAAVGDEPPLRFDPDELIRRGRHERKRRRALVAVGVATLVITGTVLSLPGLLATRPGAGPPGFDAAASPVLTTTAAPLPAETTPVPTSAPARALDAKSLAAYATRQVRALLPEVKVLRAEFTDVAVAGDVTGFVQFFDEQGVTRITAQLSAPTTPTSAREGFCAEAKCEAPRRLPDGSHLRFAEVVDPSGKLITYSVAHFRVDGSVVRFNAHNHDPVDGTPVSRDVPLTGDQLAKLATDPGFAAW